MSPFSAIKSPSGGRARLNYSGAVSSFRSQIKAALPTTKEIAHRRWIYVPYDRFTDRVGPIAEQAASDTGLVLVESTAKALRRPYHKKKLVALISNMRHFALEQQDRSAAVLYHFTETSHAQALLELQRSRHLPVLTCTQPAERELRLDLESAQKSGLALQLVPDSAWVSTTRDFTETYGPLKPGKSYVMDRFYRRMRQKTGILMQGSKPRGGQFSLDSENRKAFRNQVPVPKPPSFAPDAITAEVIAMVENVYPHHFGTSADFDLPCAQAECDRFWSFFLDHLLPHFGPFEDAMRDDHLQLFHSKTSVLLNLGRLLPADLIRDVAEHAEQEKAPLSSCEGFIRQLLGWREFMRHIHEQTDGYRLLKDHVPQERSRRPQEPSPDQTPAAVAAYQSPSPADPYAGARPSALHASRPLPAVYWGAKSGLHCVDTVVAQVIHEGWSHHITRLMVLSNLATLCGFSPRELTDWFWFAYIDAYDWVVEPNVLGMATYADGGLTATKPYVSGAAYIHRMSNYCAQCEYDPKRSTGPGSCPFTSLYWTFLERNQSILGDNFRMSGPYQSLRKKKPEELVQLRARAEQAIAHLESFARPEYGAPSLRE
jgi:deoxyribodipyrimidine photolyase-related protein